MCLKKCDNLIESIEIFHFFLVINFQLFEKGYKNFEKKNVFYLVYFDLKFDCTEFQEILSCVFQSVPVFS